jgi:hypothetical protein
MFARLHRLPVAGIKFARVQWHWMAGLLLTASILFHIVHATLWLIWVDPGGPGHPGAAAERSRVGHDVPGLKSGIRWQSPVSPASSLLRSASPPGC